MRNAKKILIAPVATLLAVLLLGLSASGCAYFNTFYLTQRNFKDGERLRKRGASVNDLEMKKFYNSAIENGALILQDYKTSRYVDDSLFIMGMSYYHMGDFVRARTKFDELLTAFPQAKSAGDARFYRARCLMELDQTDEARIDLNELAVSGNRSLAGRAGLTLAEIDFRAGDWDALITATDRVVAAQPDDSALQDAIIYRGEALFNLERYQEAVDTLQKLADKKLKPAQRFRVNTRIALSLANLEKFDAALQVLESMQNRGEFAVFAPGIRLEIGRILELKGDTEQALEAYRTMAADYPDSVAAREAWYRVGVVTLRDLRNAQESRDAFVKVTENKKIEQTWFLDASAKVTQIDSLKSRTERIEKLADQPAERAHERFLLAELLTWFLDHRKEALFQYTKIMEEAPESEFAVRSHYLLGLAELEESGKRTDEAEREVMQRTVDQYPDSQFAQELKVRLGVIEVPPDVRLFREAELARMSNQGPDVYLPLYQAVVDSFPQNRVAYQARFVLAYCYEHEKHDRETGFKLYRELAMESPNDINREYVSLATAKLNLILDEKQILEKSRQNIAYYESEIGLTATDAPTPQTAASVNHENGYSEFRKIRARNARIRGRYYTD